jgi:hypothetical protein
VIWRKKKKNGKKVFAKKADFRGREIEIGQEDFKRSPRGIRD